MHTESGQSGGPVYTQEGNKIEAIGIHKGREKGKNFNVFTLITDRML